MHLGPRFALCRHSNFQPCAIIIIIIIVFFSSCNNNNKRVGSFINVSFFHQNFKSNPQSSLSQILSCSHCNSILMAGNFRFMMDQKDIVRFLTTTIDSFIQDRLINKEQRTQHKEQCAERLAAEDGNDDKDTEVEYSDQAVLANLDWGIEALEEAINTYNMETKLARLDYAEKMLQVCAMLNPKQKTAGVPNSYLSAWAHLNLSYLWKLRNNIQNCIFHSLEMFIVDPFFSRIDFAPELWKNLFLPHMSSIVGWYSEERHRLMMEVMPESTDLSYTADFDKFFNESLVLSMRPHQLDKLQKLEQLYGDSLDDNTRLYAKYYNDCMNPDSTSSKKLVPMLPIAEPPMTPLHELSRSVPDFVKFGPILPKSAGFSMTRRSKDGVTEAIRLEFLHQTLSSKSSACILFHLNLLVYEAPTQIQTQTCKHWF